MTLTLDKPEVSESIDSRLAPEDDSLGPADLAHYLNCPDDKESTEAWITEARVFGLEVTALCGYRWVPQDDPASKKICRPCVDEAARIAAEVWGL